MEKHGVFVDCVFSESPNFGSCSPAVAMSQKSTLSEASFSPRETATAPLEDDVMAANTANPYFTKPYYPATIGNPLGVSIPVTRSSCLPRNKKVLVANKNVENNAVAVEKPSRKCYISEMKDVVSGDVQHVKDMTHKRILQKDTRKAGPQTRHNVERGSDLEKVFDPLPNVPPPSLAGANNTNSSRVNVPISTDIIDSLQSSNQPSPIAPQLIRSGVHYITSEERAQRDRQVVHALNVISQSMEPAVRTVDAVREHILKCCHPEEGAKPTKVQELVSFLLGIPFAVVRCLWNFVALQAYLIFNLTLIFGLFLGFPIHLGLFIIGMFLFWLKIIYDVIQDIMHRDDPLYQSNLSADATVGTLLSASVAIYYTYSEQRQKTFGVVWANDNPK